jgi:AraC-like DNA-binding protein
MAGTALSQTCGARTPVLWIRPWHAGYLGPELDVGMHATPIACVGLGLDGPFVFETAEHGEIAARSSFAPARTCHRIVTDEWIGLVFAEPASRAATALRHSMCRTVGPYGFDSRYEPTLIAAAGDGVAGIDRVLSELAQPPQPTDPRIVRVMDAIRIDPVAHVGAAKAAASAGVSVSHFLRTFAAHTGTTFRRYHQWARLRSVGSGLDAGHDVTRCAADAGFASPSHLSETFRRTFGLSLTALLGSQVQLDIR